MIAQVKRVKLAWGISSSVGGWENYRMSDLLSQARSAQNERATAESCAV